MTSPRNAWKPADSSHDILLNASLGSTNALDHDGTESESSQCALALSCCNPSRFSFARTGISFALADPFRASSLDQECGRLFFHASRNRIIPLRSSPVGDHRSDSGPRRPPEISRPAGRRSDGLPGVRRLQFGNPEQRLDPNSTRSPYFYHYAIYDWNGSGAADPATPATRP